MYEQNNSQDNPYRNTANQAANNALWNLSGRQSSNPTSLPTSLPHSLFTNPAVQPSSIVNLSNSTDVVIGPMTQYQGPVTIYQYMDATVEARSVQANGGGGMLISIYLYINMFYNSSTYKFKLDQLLRNETNTMKAFGRKSKVKIGRIVQCFNLYMTCF